jgi:hypothetical protein
MTNVVHAGNRVQRGFSPLAAGLVLVFLSGVFAAAGPAPLASAVDPSGPVVLEFSKSGCTDPAEEDADIKVALEVISASVTLFDGGDGSLTAWTTALTGVDVLVIPEGGFFDCASAVSPDAQAYIKTWVQSGKTVLGTGSYTHVDFVNYMSGIDYSLVWADGGLANAILNPWTRQVSSTTLPATVPNANYAGGLRNYSTYSAAQKAIMTPIYYSAGEDNLGVVQFRFGSGDFLYYAYDWYPSPADVSSGARADWNQALQFGATGQITRDAGSGGSGGAAVGEPELPPDPRLALDFRGVAGQPSEGAVVGVSGLSVPAGAVATVSLFAPEVKLFEEVSTGGAFDRAVALPAGLAPGSYTVVYQVVLPSGEVLALNVVIEIGDGGVITSVSENIVGSGPAGVPGAMTELSYTGVRSSSLPWWAIITIFGGLMLIVYSRRAVKMAEAFDARLDENGHRTPWEILSTPIRVPGIDYSPGALDAAGSSQSLGEAVRGLDVAFSLIIASQIARLRTHA